MLNLLRCCAGGAGEGAAARAECLAGRRCRARSRDAAVELAGRERRASRARTAANARVGVADYFQGRTGPADPSAARAAAPAPAAERLDGTRGRDRRARLTSYSAKRATRDMQRVTAAALVPARAPRAVSITYIENIYNSAVATKVAPAE